FTGVPATPGQALTILAHNGRLLAAVGGLLVIAQSPLHAGWRPGTVLRALRRLGELWLAAVAAAHVLLVGAAVGAYGARMIRGVLPHGPVELAAYALMGSVYLQGRSTRLSLQHVAAVTAGSAGLLALAAALEAFVTV